LQNLLSRAGGLEGKRSLVHGGCELQQTFGALNLGVVSGLCHGVAFASKILFDSLCVRLGVILRPQAEESRSFAGAQDDKQGFRIELFP
jgi:hypothetical protein